jgi:hypothetical protein
VLFAQTPHPSAMIAVARVCECWWLQQRPHRETVVLHALMYALTQSVEANAKPADVRRVYQARGNI